jgi:hypothetical protein
MTLVMLGKQIRIKRKINRSRRSLQPLGKSVLAVKRENWNVSSYVYVLGTRVEPTERMRIERVHPAEACPANRGNTPR